MCVRQIIYCTLKLLIFSYFACLAICIYYDCEMKWMIVPYSCECVYILKITIYPGK